MGTYTWTNGNEYTGEFKMGNKEGYGSMIWNDGTIYNGNWKNGKRHGYGTIKYARTGNIYEGEWLNGKKDGRGSLQLNSGDYAGQTLKGNWRNGEYQRNTN